MNYDRPQWAIAAGSLGKNIPKQWNLLYMGHELIQHRLEQTALSAHIFWKTRMYAGNLFLCRSYIENGNHRIYIGITFFFLQKLDLW
jgi:hypothetical protein